jgi:hypothetical protein
MSMEPRIQHMVLGLLLVAGISAGCAATTPSPAVTVSAAASASSTPSSTPAPTQIPSPSAVATLPDSGSWAGAFVLPGDTRTRMTFSLHACTLGTGCGSIELRDADGLGCPYQIQSVDANSPVIAGPNELVFDVTNAGGIDCEEGGLVDAILFVRPASGGSIDISRVTDVGRGPSFTLDPAAAPSPTPPPSAAADRTTVTPGAKVTITIAGFPARSTVSVVLEQDGGPGGLLANVGLDSLGAAIVVVTIPNTAIAGPATIWVEGSDRNAHDNGAPIAIVVTRK